MIHLKRRAAGPRSSCATEPTDQRQVPPRSLPARERAREPSCSNRTLVTASPRAHNRPCARQRGVPEPESGLFTGKSLSERDSNLDPCGHGPHETTGPSLDLALPPRRAPVPRGRVHLQLPPKTQARSAQSVSAYSAYSGATAEHAHADERDPRPAPHRDDYSKRACRVPNIPLPPVVHRLSRGSSRDRRPKPSRPARAHARRGRARPR